MAVERGIRMKTAELYHRVALVTGAGKGIGQATAVALPTLGARVVLSGRSRGPLEQTLLLVERAGGRGSLVIGDVADESMAEETVARALKEFGRLDIAAYTAGVSPRTRQTAHSTPQT